MTETVALSLVDPFMELWKHLHLVRSWSLYNLLVCLKFRENKQLIDVGFWRGSHAGRNGFFCLHQKI